ncbi:MAG: hypothetical protein QP763_08405 [Peptoniphilus duerdenii]|uniref:hypothetical protein n=1 Tax=Peptoniphilus duerdenii TaxID=507750 RepID=UPI002551BAF4|nr:hypothetical protein [Peptoniphilus duerdenii]MDK8277058.1 hypothetical protein [Peptoniphilus duerdenii]
MREIDNNRREIDLYLEKTFEKYPVTRRNIEIKEKIRENMYLGFDDMIKNGLNPTDAREKLLSEFSDMKELSEVLDTEEEELPVKKGKRVPTVNILLAALLIFFVFSGNGRNIGFWSFIIIIVIINNLFDKK